MNHTRRTLAAALALSAALLSPLSGCDADATPADAGSGGQDSGSNTGDRDASGSPDTGPVDTGATDSGAASDASGAPDVNTSDSGTIDSGEDSGAADAGADANEDTGPDASADVGEDVGEDAGQDAGEDVGLADMGSSVDYSNRPEGMCVTSSDCGAAGGLTCNREAAGGACSGCGDCSNIPGPDTHTCKFGTCVRDCSVDDDCAPGRQCSSAGLCVVERCTNDVCPIPWFVCTSPDGICTRASCSGGEVCPAETTCTNGYCVEDHSLP